MVAKNYLEYQTVFLIKQIGYHQILSVLFIQKTNISTSSLNNGFVSYRILSSHFQNFLSILLNVSTTYQNCLFTVKKLYIRLILPLNESFYFIALTVFYWIFQLFINYVCIWAYLTKVSFVFFLIKFQMCKAFILFFNVDI